ncbi:poly(A) polymerase [Campylobacter sp. RM10532]|uniref:Poly(A) polymerase n=1 Tax=Campylobacter molothri TaxID=1032242 RepID=A0ACC5W0S2_9BACT|nr:poly(A) polymerase [Campylobacter sp. 2018MI35]MBZ7929716.1 poly(A) polymerase [Campylobacter sp. W0067]MBZ7933442.1 poly(A) polymerase [Campylobacter sp. RM10543]MBZ7936891.1 poly(A) polymerase [Campylobacter sp. RM10538]MBZ7944354.1 poly(A) polymerase [Campylobacter sp. RM13744]MBZ7944825.1 poly(A) polymerase [Campylobacter sp. RM10532]MBZ7947735.1 poly(A) polymerase [Campylobacter sp. RM9929]MBZ7958025.1 poly(A) polymerase [Campylobacter sp. RM9760]MBZ7959504.1 poly(A) polymerase [Cam
MDALENQRILISKRLKILKFLSTLEAIIVLFLAFVFTKDSIISLILALLVGIFFFRFTSKKLILAKKELQINALNLFLKRFGAKFKKEGLSQKDFLKLEIVSDLKEFKSQNCFDFKEFKIYDVQFINTNKEFFCGILLQSLNSNKKHDFSDEKNIYTKLKNKNFTLDYILNKNNYFLIATLKNPFFIDLNQNLKDNFEILEKNLNSIKNKFL